MKKQHTKYYYSDSNLQLHEVNSFRLKIAGIIFASVVLCMTALLVINHTMHDVLGLGYDRINTLTRENKELQAQLSGLTNRMNSLKQEVQKLNGQGNELRLMVDLPPMDESVASGGIGGAVQQPDVNIASDQTANMLLSSITSLQKLNGEIKVQEQSYEEVLKKYDYNKGYFAALPALKPMDGYYSPSGFGLRMHPVLGIFKTHQGLDIIGDVGTSVYASGDGVVAMAGQTGGGYGTVVAINHGYGYQTLYAHLSKVLVHEGQRVHRGDLIAKSGRTGLVSGPHLHYEVRYNGVCKNPVDFFLDDVTAQEYRSSIAVQ